MLLINCASAMPKPPMQVDNINADADADANADADE